MATDWDEFWKQFDQVSPLVKAGRYTEALDVLKQVRGLAVRLKRRNFVEDIDWATAEAERLRREYGDATPGLDDVEIFDALKFQTFKKREGG